MKQLPKIYSQRDPLWATQRLGTVNGATIGSDGCYITCFSMLACFYNHTVTPAQLDDLFTKNNWYSSGNLLTDDGLVKAYPDIKYQQTFNYQSTAADLGNLKNLLADPNTSVVLEVDFDHNPNDGIQTHFVVAVDCDGTNVTIADPWYGTVDPFIKNYGNNPTQTILKFVVYKGTPVTATQGTYVDAVTFSTLVSKSTANDTVCDNLSLTHNAGKDAEIAAINQLKVDKANAEKTAENLNKQIPALEAQIQPLQNEVTDLKSKAYSADNLLYKDLYDQAESNLTSARKDLADQVEQYNRAVAQFESTSYLAATWQDLAKELLKRIFKLK